MTDLERIEKKLDEQQRILDEALPIIQVLGAILVQRKVANQRLGLNKNTLAKNDKVAKYEEDGHRRTYVEVRDLAVLRRQKRKK